MSLVPQKNGFSNTGSNAPKQTSGMMGSSSNQLALAPGQNGGATRPPLPSVSQGTTAGHIPAPKTNIGNHTVTTAPNGQTTTKVTYANGASSGGKTGVTAPPPAPLDTASNAQRVLGASGQTAGEASAQGAVTNVGQNNQDYKRIQDEIAQNLQKQTDLTNQYQNQKGNLQGSGIDLSLANGQEGILANKYNAGYGALTSQGAGLSSQLGAANTQQGLQLTGAQSGLTAQQNIASRGQQGAENVFGASQYSPASYLSTPFSGLGGFQSGNGANSGANSGVDRAITAGNIQSANTFTGDYNTGKAMLSTADGIQQQIINTLQSNPTLNNQPISALTNLNEFLSGQTSDPSQQLLSQQVNNYIKTLGLDPASIANIAHQQGGTLGQLLDSLRQTANNQVESKNPANLKTNTSTSSGGGTPNPWK